MDLNKILLEINSKFDFRKTAEINGIKFELGLLSLSEEQLVSSLPSDDEDPMTYYTNSQKHLLSYAVRKINDEVIPDIVEVEEEGQTVTKERPVYLRDFISKLPGKVIDKLYDVYVDLKEQSEENLEKEMKYDWYKTPKQREEERKKKEEEEKEEPKINLRKIEEPLEEEPKEEFQENK